MKKRILSILLALVMVIGMLPATGLTAHAAETMIDTVTLTMPYKAGETLTKHDIDFTPVTLGEGMMVVKTTQSGFSLTVNGLDVPLEGVELKVGDKIRLSCIINTTTPSRLFATGVTATVNSKVVPVEYIDSRNIRIEYEHTVCAVESPANVRWDGYTVRWDKVSNATSYEVVLWRGDTGVHVDTTTATQYNFSSYMVAGGTYRVSVYSINADGKSKNSNAPNITIPGSIGTVSGIKWDGYKLSWNPVPNTHNYSLKLRYSDGREVSKGSIVTTDTTADFTLKIAEAGSGSYYVEVDANHMAPGNWMATGTSATKAFTAPLLYNVTYSPGEGTITNGTHSNETKCFGDYTLPEECRYTPPTGKVFSKWDVNGTEYEPGTVITPTGDITITAKYVTKADDRITSVALTLPEAAGQKLNLAAIKVPTGVAYKVTAIENFTKNGSTVSGNELTLADGDQVFIQVRVEATGTAEFKEGLTATMNGNSATVSAFGPTGFKVAYQFTVGGAGGSGEVDSVALTLPEAAGQKLNLAAIKVPTGAAYKVTAIVDFTNNGSSVSGKELTLADGDQISIQFWVEPTGTATFKDGVNVTINGNAPSKLVESPASLKVTYQFTVGGAGGSGEVDSVALTLPETAGETLNLAAIKVPSGAAYEVTSIESFTNNGYNVSSRELTLVAGDQISIQFWVDATGTATFKDGVNVTINGNAPSAVVPSSLNLKVTYQFTVGGAGGSGEVDSVALTLPETPGTLLTTSSTEAITVPSGAGYRVMSFNTLKVNSTPFSSATLAEGNVVEVLIDVETTDSSTFPTDMTAKVNGKPATVTRNFGTWIRVSYTFTVGKSAPILSGTVSGSGISVEAKNFSGSVTLMVAQYEGSKMVDVEMQTITSNGTYNFTELTHKSGCTYKAFLVNSTTYAPLCAADAF